jgi:hypothetical protein
VGWKSNSDGKDKERVDNTDWRVVTNWDAQNRHEHRNAFPFKKKKSILFQEFMKKSKKCKNYIR